jgi:U4/U6.U5 tri-snRNP-associated protein 1
VERRPYAEKPKAEDDIASWVNKSRKLDEQKKLEEKKKAARMAAILAEQDKDEEESDDEFNQSGYRGKDLAGLKVRHGLDKVMEGAAVVLTLKDTNILVDGDLNDGIVLISTLALCFVLQFCQFLESG